MRPGPSGSGGGNGSPNPGGEQSWRWIWLILLVAVLAVLIIPSLIPRHTAKTISYSSLISNVQDKQVSSANIDNTTGVITGTLKDGTSYTANGPTPPSNGDATTMRKDGVSVKYTTSGPSLLSSLAPYLILGLLVVGMFYYVTPLGPRTDERDHVDRPIPGAALHRGATLDDVRRRGGLLGRQTGDQRGRRFPQDSRALPRHRRKDPQGRTARRAPRAPARPCSPAPWPERQAFPSCP